MDYYLGTVKPRIEVIPEKLLIGKSMRMSLSKNKTSDLWKDFMTNKSVIENPVGTDLYSVQVYDQIEYFKKFSPDTEFTKWAVTEVKNHKNIPKGFLPFKLESGLYAVFFHKGLPSTFPKIIQFIFGEWLPNSEYDLDDRPHFELLGINYKNNDPSSEEELWIPIRKRV